MQKNCSVVILAAGYSSRMGKLKFALTLANGSTFIENIVRQYAEFGCREIIVVVNINGKEYFDVNPIKGITVVINHHPERERLFSLKTGLLKITGTYPVFVHNADNPFAGQAILKALFASRGEADFIKPIFKNKGGHPIIISNRIVRDIVSCKNYDVHLNEFLKNYPHGELEADDENILININTIDEYLNL